MSAKALLTDAELAETLAVSRNTVRNWHKAGTIPAAIHEGGVLRFDPAAVSKALAKRAQKNVTPRKSGMVLPTC